MALISCEKLNVNYGDQEVIENLSFHVEKGDYLCIVGENGSGKTTLMKTMLSLVKPHSGTITFDEGLKRNEIGYLPQQTHIQKDFPATVEEVVLSGCLNHLGKRYFYNAEDKALAKKHMEELDIIGLAKKSYRELSGGQQQRVLLARALCATKEVLLLDEPVSGLDPKTTEEMYALISDLNKKGLTIIMISHDIDEILKYAKHILAFNHDVFFGSVKEYKERILQKL